MASGSNQRKKQKKEKEVMMVTDSDSEEPFTSESIDWDAPEPNIIWMPSSCSRFVSNYLDYLYTNLTVGVLWCHYSLYH